MARDEIPTIGPRGANLIRLSPDVLRILRRRARRRAKREFNPQIEMLRTQKERLRGQLRRELASIQGAADMASEAVSDTSLRGLRGSARRQVAEEMASRSAAIQGAVPFLASEARQGFRTAKMDAMDKILSARLDKQKAMQDTLSAMIDSTTTDAQSIAKERRKRARDRRTERGELSEQRQETRSAYSDALRRVENLIITGGGPDQEWRLPASEADWRAVEMRVEGGEGVTSKAAQKAVAEAKRYVAALNRTGMSRKEIRDRLESGLFPFGV